MFIPWNAIVHKAALKTAEAKIITTQLSRGPVRCSQGRSNTRSGTALEIAHDYRIFAYHVLVRTGDLQAIDLAGIASGSNAPDADRACQSLQPEAGREVLCRDPLSPITPLFHYGLLSRLVFLCT